MKSIEEFYEKYDESARLADGNGDVERLRTRDILSRFLPAPPAVVLDIGGGTGAHALPLAKAGYQVHLIDPVLHHVEQAQHASKAHGDLALRSCAVGEAQALPFPDDFADAALMFGPLYHLVEREDRLRALREALRALRPDGILFAGAISRFASLIDGISHDLIDDPAFVKILQQDLQTGQHRNATADPRYFTTAYFHRPEELSDELISSGFVVERVIGVEGPFWDSGAIPGWERAERRTLVLDLLREVETEPSLLGASAHFIAVGCRPETP